MCRVCHMNPCHPACPNAEPKSICECAECGEPIYKGDRVAEINGDYYHTECLETIGIEKLLDICDIDVFDADSEMIAS